MSLTAPAAFIHPTNIGMPAFMDMYPSPGFNDPTEIAARRDPEIKPCKRYGESEPVFY
jgi:hypothetical protein